MSCDRGLTTRFEPVRTSTAHDDTANQPSQNRPWAVVSSVVQLSMSKLNCAAVAVAVAMSSSSCRRAGGRKMLPAAYQHSQLYDDHGSKRGTSNLHPGVNVMKHHFQQHQHDPSVFSCTSPMQAALQRAT